MLATSQWYDLKRYVSLVASALALPMVIAQAAPPPKQLCLPLPDTTNAVVAIDVEGLLKSARSEQNQWQQKRAARMTGPFDLPTLASNIVLAAEVDFRAAQPLWEMTFLALRESIGINTLASLEGGRVDELASRQVIHSPRDLLFAVDDQATVIGLYPADRQRFSRFLRSTNAAAATTASPLVAAVDYVAQDGHVAIALNMQDVADARTCESFLATMPEIAKNKASIPAIANTLASIRMVVIGIKVESNVQGRVVVEFSQPCDNLQPYASALFAGILRKKGAMIDGVEKWPAKAGGSQLVLAGELSDDGMQSLMSLFELPTASVQSAEAATPSKAEASREYFAAAAKQINSLHSKRGAGSLGEYALWYETAARKLDNLPILNVDSDLIAWGHATADRIRSIAAAYRSVGPKVAMSAGEYDDYGDNNNFYTVRKQERGQAGLSRVELWNEIDQAMALARQQMTERYQIEF